jgi:tRNA-splicing ligase RtcB
MDSVLRILREQLQPFQIAKVAANSHHNYTTRETHFGEEVLVTRKGAVRAGLGELGIIPGSMGARSYIVRGLGNPESLREIPRCASQSALTATSLRRSRLMRYP